MLKKFWNWLIYDDIQPCVNCEFLKDQLEENRIDRDKLLTALLSINSSPNVVVEKPLEDIKPIMPKEIPWRIRREMLEANDRDSARKKKLAEEIIKESARPIEDLERELGVDNASEIG